DGMGTGRYQVRELLPTGWVNVSSPRGFAVTRGDTFLTGLDFADVRPRGMTSFTSWTGPTWGGLAAPALPQHLGSAGPAPSRPDGPAGPTAGWSPAAPPAGRTVDAGGVFALLGVDLGMEF